MEITMQHIGRRRVFVVGKYFLRFSTHSGNINEEIAEHRPDLTPCYIERHLLLEMYDWADAQPGFGNGAVVPEKYYPRVMASIIAGEA